MITRMNTWEHQVGRAAATYPGLGRGGGCLYPILSKTNVSFDGRNPGSGVTTQDIPVAQGIDSSSWVFGLVAVRLHERNTWANGASLKAMMDLRRASPGLADLGETAIVDPRCEIVWLARRMEVAFDGAAGTTTFVDVATGVSTDEFVTGTLVAILHAKNA